MAAAGGDGLLRWLLGGLLAGAILLGLVVAVREIAGHGSRNGAPAFSAAPAYAPGAWPRSPSSTTRSG